MLSGLEVHRRYKVVRTTVPEIHVPQLQMLCIGNAEALHHTYIARLRSKASIYVGRMNGSETLIPNIN